MRIIELRYGDKGNVFFWLEGRVASILFSGARVASATEKEEGERKAQEEQGGQGDIEYLEGKSMFDGFRLVEHTEFELSRAQLQPSIVVGEEEDGVEDEVTIAVFAVGIAVIAQREHLRIGGIASDVVADDFAASGNDDARAFATDDGGRRRIDAFRGHAIGKEGRERPFECRRHGEVMLCEVGFRFDVVDGVEIDARGG